MGITHFQALCAASGYFTGTKNLERPFVDGSGYISSGKVNLNALAANFDYGTVGFSGLLYSVSTRLTSIVAATATAKYAQGELFASGKITTVGIDWSGHCLDFQAAYVNTSTNTSAPACSGVVSWIAFGT